MSKSPINLYSGKPAGHRSLADLLSQEQPINLCDLSELPAPDRQRPTRQQLLTLRHELQEALKKDRDLLNLSMPFESMYPQEVADVKADVRILEQRLKNVNTLLNQPQQQGLAA